MVWPSAETEISSPMTPPRARVGAPVTGLSRTREPRAVTPTIAGGRAVVWLTRWAPVVADGVEDAAVLCAELGLLPPPQAATRVSAAGTASTRSSFTSPPSGMPQLDEPTGPLGAAAWEYRSVSPERYPGRRCRHIGGVWRDTPRRCPGGQGGLRSGFEGAKFQSPPGCAARALRGRSGAGGLSDRAGPGLPVP